MKDQVPTIALVSSLAMVLIALVILSLHGHTTDGPVLIGLVGAVGTVVGVIGGFSQNKPSQPPPKETKPVIDTPPKEN